MRSHEVWEVMLGEGADDLLAHLVHTASEAARTPMAVVAIHAGPTVILRAHSGFPDALELSGGASAKDWPLQFSAASDLPIVNSRGLALVSEPGTAASMLGDFATVAVPLLLADEVCGSLAVIDSRAHDFPADTAPRLQELWTRALQFLRERARCSALLELCSEPFDGGSLFASIRSGVHEARCSYHRMRVSATLARWHVAGRLPRTDEFCRVVEEALLAAAELSRHVKDLARWSRRLDPAQPEVADFASAVAEADLVEPAFRPGLKVVQAARARVRSPALWTSALGALPMAADLEPWGTDTIARLVQSSDILLKVRTSPPAA